MRIGQIAIGLLAIAASASAQQINAGNDAVLGSVDAIFVCESRGYFVEKKLVRKTEGKELWADVRLGARSQPQMVNELARLEANAAIERGDIVEMRLAQPTLIIQGTMREVSRVHKLVAKHDSLEALLFGIPDLRRTENTQGLFAQAQMCLVGAM